MNIVIASASTHDAARIAELRNDAAQHLTASFGKGHWSYQTSEKGVLYGMKGNSKVLIAKHGSNIVGTLQLATKKPWAIDLAYFTKVSCPLYLVGMAIHPGVQRKGIGKYMMQEVRSFAAAWPAQAIRLDAYDATAGAGEFYRKCGYSKRGRVVYRKAPLIYFELLV